MITENPTLPRFRKDLEIYNGPLEIDGSPTYNIYDPVKSQFYKISWKESLIFKMFSGKMSAEELSKTISRNFPVDITTEDVNQFFAQAHLLGLLNMPQKGQALYEKYSKSQRNWWGWFLEHYLFLKIPVFHPDNFLTKTLPWFKFLGSKAALTLFIILIITSLTLLLNRLDQFFHTFSYYFNLEGIILFACVMTCVKCIHELSHAYTAKNFGLYVPTMGIALLVLWPVLYTDVTEGWKLRNRRERFLISFAGIAAESVMAGFATIGWILSSPGIFQTLCFLVASTSWFMTILINVNPAVRFDGYYLLSDLWGIDNLMSRAFAYTRWQFHKTFFGIDVECPEMEISKKRGAGFILYALYTITYRFFLYTAIALFVYYEFTKVIGIALFSAEIWIFFLMPVVWEVKNLYLLRSKIKANLPTALTAATIFVMAALFFLPFPHQITLPGVIAAQKKEMIYAPETGKIKKIMAQNGLEVHPGTPLIQIDSEELNLEIAENDHDRKVLENELLLYTNLPDAKDLVTEKQAELSQSEQIQLALLKRLKRLHVTATDTGKIIAWNTQLTPGEYVYEGQIFGHIADVNQVEVVAFVKETDIAYIKKGEPAKIFFQKSDINILSATVKNVDHERTRELLYPSLASIYGGPLAVVPSENNHSSPEWLLHDSYYLVTLDFSGSEENVNLGQSVEVKIQGPWRSYFVEMLKYVYRNIFKESSF
jgi:putative peptide zinc metalloprotease protein